MRYFYRMKILDLFGKEITPEAAAILESVGDVDHRVMTHAELAEAAGAYDAIFMGLYPEVDRAVLEHASKLKAVASASTNLYHIDVPYAKARGIAVLTLQGEDEFLHTITGTAELAAGLMIDLVRRTPWAFDDVKRYRWDRDAFRGHNLFGKTLGILGLGRLGSWMARYGNAFGMRVVACSPHSSDERFTKFHCEKVGLDALLQESDIISLHPQLTDETRHIIDAAALAKMKKTPTS